MTSQIERVQQHDYVLKRLASSGIEPLLNSIEEFDRRRLDLIGC